MMKKIHIFPIFAFSLITFFTETVMAEEMKVDVGVVLDFEGRVGKIGLSCINMSLSDFYATHSHYKTRLIIHSRDSRKEVLGAAASALDLIKNVEVKAIIGPTTSEQSNFVIELGQKAQVPIISFSASSPSLDSLRSSYFFRATRSDSFQAKAISAIVKAFGWRKVVPVYVENEFGVGIIPYLISVLEEVDTQIPYQSAISPLATDDQILKELYKLKAMQTRVFVVHMLPSLGSRLFLKAKEIGMMGKGYVWIITDGMAVFLNSMDSLVLEAMEGVLGIKPYVPRTKRNENFRAQWKRKFYQENPEMVHAELNIYGLSAYDATTALAMAIEKVATRTTDFSFGKANISTNSTTDLEITRVSKIGPEILQTLSNIGFRGLAGNFQFLGGQLKSSGFKIININGDGIRRVGYWVPENGLVKRLKPLTARTSSLSTVIWPGDTTRFPKGWDIPKKGKKLRIGVPVKLGFKQFVNVTKDPKTNTSRIEGYCIDLFDAVISELPYAVTYEYIPFANPDGTSAGTYNDLIDQVYFGNFDAAVGDILIVANRSLYVDFGLPYKESASVTMLVPFTDDESMKAWIFLKPLSWDLWVTTLCFFIFIGFVIWVLEHRINDDFRGPPSQQVGTSFSFSFSTMVFSHREKVVSNLARMVLIIWCFVVLILTQSYTASLSSFLTIKQLRPTVTSISELIKNEENVGFQKGSYVKETLKNLGFPESKIFACESAEQCDHLLQKGSRNGGISAAFEEPASMQLILAQNCSKYTLVQPTLMVENPSWRKNVSNINEFKTNGLGFAFQKGSPLVADISRGILKVTEGEKAKKIEAKWFGKQGTCPDNSDSDPTNRLSLNSFSGLFLIAGISSFLALSVYISMFIYQNREILKSSSDSSVSIWGRILHLCRIFNQKDFKSHSFKKNVPRDGNGTITPEMENGLISQEDPFNVNH